MDQMRQEFDTFKSNNDLDKLFAKGIDVPTRTRILSQIKDLMVESDWDSINKEAVEK